MEEALMSKLAEGGAIALFCGVLLWLNWKMQKGFLESSDKREGTLLTHNQKLQDIAFGMIEKNNNLQYLLEQQGKRCADEHTGLRDKIAELTVQLKMYIDLINIK